MDEETRAEELTTEMTEEPAESPEPADAEPADAEPADAEPSPEATETEALQETGTRTEAPGPDYDELGMPDEGWMSIDDLYQNRKTGISAEDADIHIRFTTQYIDRDELPDDEGEGDGQDADSSGDEKPALSPEDEAIKRRIIERKKANAEKKKRARTRLKVILVSAALIIGGFLFTSSDFFTITSIEVQGNEHYSWEEILNISHAVPGRNLIYNPGTNEIVEYLEQNPYIKSATVTRKLPSTLLINVTERQEACAFKYDNDYLVMDEEGILLRKTRTEPKLTRVEGLVVSKIKLGQKIGTKDSKQFEKLLKLLQATRKGDLYFVRIDISEEEKNGTVIAYIYDSLMVKTDYDTLITFIKNGKLHKSIEWLFDEGIKRGTITLGEDGTVSFEPGI